MKYEFVEISEAEFREFAAGAEWKSFMQTPEIAKLREKQGWTAYYFGAREHLPQDAPGNEGASHDNLLAAAMAVAKPTFLGKSLWLVPGGPLLDLENAGLSHFFLTSLKRYAETHNGYALRLSPYYDLIERSRSGEKIEGGYDRTLAIQTLLGTNFKALTHTDQPKYLFVLNIDGKSPEELMASFKSNTRGHIRKAEKMGVHVRELKKNELPILKEITAATAERREFEDRPLEYYQDMYDLFHPRGEVKFMVAEAEIDGRVTPLSAAMFILYGDEVVYLFSGSDEKYMREYNAQYLIQWEMIKFASENKFRRYNFYGIQGLPDKNAKDYGIYDFKKGFTSEENGRVVELIGTYEAGLGVFYTLYSFLKRLRQN